MPGGSTGARRSAKGRVNTTSLNTARGVVKTSRPVARALPNFIKPARFSASYEGAFAPGALLPQSVYVTQGYHPGHLAYDLAAPVNAPIYAPVNMTVTRAGWGNLGNEVRGITPEGMEYAFGHLNTVADFTPGEKIKAGTLLGYEGSTFNADVGGYSTGPHLHLQKKKNNVNVMPTAEDALYSFYPYAGFALGGSNTMTTQIVTGAGARTITQNKTTPNVSPGSGSRAVTTRAAISSGGSSSTPINLSGGSSPAPAQTTSNAIQGVVNNAISGAVAQTVDSLKPKWLKGKTALDIAFVFGGGGLLIFGLIYILMTLRNGDS